MTSNCPLKEKLIVNRKTKLHNRLCGVVVSKLLLFPHHATNLNTSKEVKMLSFLTKFKSQIIIIGVALALFIAGYYYVKSTSYAEGKDDCRKEYQEQISSNNAIISSILGNIQSEQNSKSDKAILEENLQRWSK